MNWFNIQILPLKDELIGQIIYRGTVTATGENHNFIVYEVSVPYDESYAAEAYNDLSDMLSAKLSKSLQKLFK